MNQTILVIDDDRDMTQLLKLRLEKRQYRVQVACDGQEGLRQACRVKPDLVILDVMMSELDGYEVCHRLRDLTDTPIIMLTARTKARDVIKGLSCGADDYVTKPFRMAELAARIRALLRRSHAERRGEKEKGCRYARAGLC